MTHDFDLRLLFEQNAELRHAETASLAVLGVALAASAAIAAFVAQRASDEVNARSMLTFPGLFLGTLLFSLGNHLHERTKRAHKAANAAVGRLTDRMGMQASDILIGFAAESTRRSGWRRVGDLSVPDLIRIYGLLLLAVAAVFAVEPLLLFLR